MRGDARLEIGGIARAHGIRGEVVVVTHDPGSQILGHVDTVWIDGAPRKILGARGTVRGWLLRLEGVITRNDAEALKGRQIEVERSQLEVGEGEVILSDLVGCRVQLPDGTPWGTVFAVDAGDLQDRLVIHDGDIERLLPLVDHFVTKIDLEAGTVTVDPPEGLPESKR
ncbi:MAG: 16S rRNA processing protein RimM [Deltaproteobacteria bacterium]|nr:16S rRNA processing protein RimM [Deltaproteobacteria bacterium]MDQ3299631.1 ribosome maturation factor RimM [Myxococcota bacterium]